MPSLHCISRRFGFIVLMIFNHLGKHLQPVRISLELLVVQSVDFMLGKLLNLSSTTIQSENIATSYRKFADNSASSPAVFQRDISKIRIRVIPKIQNIFSAPLREIEKLFQRSLNRQIEIYSRSGISSRDHKPRNKFFLFP